MSHDRFKLNHAKIVFGLLIVIVVTYFLTFPKGWLISDEDTYVNHALAFLNGETFLSYTDIVTGNSIPFKSSTYTLGNSFWIALWALFFGIKYSYFGSLFILISSYYLLYRILQHEKLYLPAICLFVIFPATLIYAHTLMSGIPSLGLASLFAYILFSKKESKIKWLSLCAIASFSFWFRETNIVLLGGICLIHFLKDRRWFGYYLLGTFFGILPRFLSALWVYNDPFYYVLGESFSFENFVNNLSLYIFLGFIFVPFGVVVFAIYRGRYRWPIVVSSFLFYLLYMFYGYNAIEYSGKITGTIVMSRFLLPLIPFYVIIVGSVFKIRTIPNVMSFILYIIGFTLVIAFQYKVHQESTIHSNVSEKIYQKYSNEAVLYDLSKTTNVIRYINPMQGSFIGEGDISLITNDNYMNTIFDQSGQVITFHTLNTANTQKQEKTDNITSYLKTAIEKYNVKSFDTIAIKSDLKFVALSFVKSKE